MEIIVFVVGVIGVIISVWQLRHDILKEVKASQIDEKISKMWGYAIDVKNWDREGNAKIYHTQQILSDIRSLKRLEKSITYQQEVKLDDACTSLTSQMTGCGYHAEVKLIKEALEGIDDDKSVWGNLR